MANVSSSYSSISVSSVYGNRNIITGLASGMDTEEMIENAVSGIKTKIESLQKQSTMLTWKQDAYRSIIDKLVNFSNKYTSYVSNTNLASQSFFNSAATTTPNGKYADKVTASGNTSSDIQILGIKQLATAATYRTFGAGNTGSMDEVPTISAADAVDLDEAQSLSNVSGSMTIKYGTRSFDLSFDDLETYDSAQEFADAINEKLSEISLSNSSGATVTADTMVEAKYSNGKIEFVDAQNAGNSVYISSATGKIKDTLKIDTSDKTKSLDLSGVDLVDESATKGEYLSGKEIKVTLDGITKTLEMPEYNKESATSANDFVAGIQEQLDNAFGKGKIEVSNSETDPSKMKLQFTTQSGSTMSISSEQGNALGFSGQNAYSYTDNSTKLGDILGSKLDSLDKIAANGEVKQVTVNNKTYFTDDDGNRVAKDTDGNWWRVDEEGAYLHEFKVNGKTVGSFSENTAMESVLTSINNSEAGVTVSYSKTTNEYLFTAKESGANGKISFDEGMTELFGTIDEDDQDSYTAGTDAVFSMTVNGKTYEDISRSSNSFDIDGMTLNLKGTFGYAAAEDTGELELIDKNSEDYEPITFTAGTDTDKIVDAIKSMVDDYNEIITEVKNAYSTQPAYKDSSYTRYEPLTADESASLTDTELANYEEKAKQGILFGDSDLSALYNSLRNAITTTTSDYNLNEIGLSTSYSDGLTTISLDETKLRSAIESNPDKVKSLFTKTKESGASTDGIMTNIKNTLDTYAKTTGDNKGILVNLAGSVKSPTSLSSNSLNTQINNIQTQIDKWTDKYADKVDYYTQQFTKLEQLIAEMNSQSSALSSLMGGTTSY